MRQETHSQKSKKSDIINGTYEVQDFIYFERNDSINHEDREALEAHKLCGQTGEHEIEEEFEIVDRDDVDGFEEEDTAEDDDLDELAEKISYKDSVSMHRYYIGALTF